MADRMFDLEFVFADSAELIWKISDVKSVEFPVLVPYEGQVITLPMLVVLPVVDPFMVTCRVMSVHRNLRYGENTLVSVLVSKFGDVAVCPSR